MQRRFTTLGFLLALLAIVATACGGSAAPKLGVPNADTVVFVYTDN